MKTNKKTLEGVVIGNKMNKTVVVEISRLIKHPVVKKYLTVKKKYKVHDGKSECDLGDKVLIRETKPISKEKCWVVTQILQKVAS